MIPTGDRRWWRRVMALGTVLVGYSALRIPPDRYVAVNLAVAACLMLVARRMGLGMTELGLGRDRLGTGLRWGGWAALTAAVVLGAAAAIPALRPLFDDARTQGIGPALLAYRTLVRIPFGTVLLEEVAFRGVLLSAWRRLASTRVAALGSSAVFGLWHIRPALDLLAANDLASGGPGRAVGVATAVVATAIAGLAFCWLRERSASLAAPYLAHAAINSLATVAAFVVRA